MNKKSTLISLISLGLLMLIACSAGAPASTQPSTTTQNNGSAPANIARVNLNTASDSDFLAAVPGLGNRMVREFMEYRPYISIQQFRQEIGKYVDDAQVAEYEQFVYVPISINDSDSETLEQIPGLSADEAASVMSPMTF